LRLGVVQVGIGTFLPAALAAFAARYPSVRLDINLNTTEEQLEMLADGRIDAAFVRPPRSLSGISSREIYREGFVAVVPAGSALAARPDLGIADLAGERFVTYSSIVGIAYQDVVFQHARAAGFRPQVVYEVSHTLGIVTLVAAGLGVGVIPAWVTSVPLAGVVYRPLPDLPQAVSLVVAWRSDNMKPFLPDFVDCTAAAAQGWMDLRSATPRAGPPPRPAAGRRTRRN
jgi:DNA-binding transcriptional LysR family regulator